MLKYNPHTGNYEQEVGQPAKVWQPGPDDGGDVAGRTPAGMVPAGGWHPEPKVQRTLDERIEKAERLLIYAKADAHNQPGGTAEWIEAQKAEVERLRGELAALKTEKASGAGSAPGIAGGGAAGGASGGAHWVTINGAHVLIEGK
jgi:hypothetical protein